MVSDFVVVVVVTVAVVIGFVYASLSIPSASLHLLDAYFNVLYQLGITQEVNTLSQ